MSNFLFKSKDMYFSDTEKYDYFNGIFDSINKLSVIKNFYESDLFNIEEILSITEMLSFLDGEELNKDFKRYISEVIKYYTPEVKPYSENGGFPGNWDDFIFGNSSIESGLYYLIGHFLRASFQETSNNSDGTRIFKATIDNANDVRYSILSLNYDSVLENATDIISKQFETSDEILFNKTEYDPSWRKTHLMKLHGCVHTGNIVPPTWAKGTNTGIVPIWKNAFEILKETNHIRFVGYSLPNADSYIKYLLKSAVLESKHLKSIDVLCMDNNGSVRERYEQFFEFNFFRFKNVDVMDYASGLKKKIKDKSRNSPHGNKKINLNMLEKYHNDFMLTP